MYIIENNLEVVEYENLLLPISIKIRELIQYKNKRALCHWHDDIEIIKILSGSMNFYINGEIFRLIKDDILIVCLSGRGDKDVAAIARYRGKEIYE